MTDTNIQYPLHPQVEEIWERKSDGVKVEVKTLSPVTTAGSGFKPVSVSFASLPTEHYPDPAWYHYDLDQFYKTFRRKHD
jgi:hypothetical protein